MNTEQLGQILKLIKDIQVELGKDQAGAVHISEPVEELFYRVRNAHVEEVYRDYLLKLEAMKTEGNTHTIMIWVEPLGAEEVYPGICEYLKAFGPRVKFHAIAPYKVKMEAD